MIISPNRVGIRNSSDYSPFGVELDGKSVSVDGMGMVVREVDIAKSLDFQRFKKRI
jgi:hypothetical protein